MPCPLRLWGNFREGRGPSEEDGPKTEEKSHCLSLSKTCQVWHWGPGEREGCPLLVDKLPKADRHTGMALKETMTPTLDEGGIWGPE